MYRTESKIMMTMTISQISSCIVLLVVLWDQVAVRGAIGAATINNQNQDGAQRSTQNNLMARWEPTVSVRMSTSVVENLPASLLRDQAGVTQLLQTGRLQRSSNQLGVGRIGTLPPYRQSIAPSLHELTPIKALRQQQQQGPQSSLPRDSPSQQDHFGKRFGSPQAALQAAIPRQLHHHETRQLSEKCKRRNIFSFIRGAKNMLTGGFAKLERHAIPGRIMLGSSLLASLVPIVALLLPDALGAQANPLGSLKALEGPKLSLQRRVGSMMGWIERSVDSLPSFPTLHPQECIKRSVCEAHLMPDKYGAIGSVTRLLFPDSNATTNNEAKNSSVASELGVINKYRIAANYGASRRSDNGTNQVACSEYYEGCLISMLDVAKNMADFFLRGNQ